MSETPRVPSLLRANERFYQVFELLDYPAMEELWEKSARVFCVHPGWSPLYGDKAVLESWKRIIENTEAMQFTLTNVEARVEGDFGVVTLHEHIYSRVGQQRHTSGAVSTNLFAFARPAGTWKMFHHHASHAAVPDEQGLGPVN